MNIINNIKMDFFLAYIKKIDTNEVAMILYLSLTRMK
jgi:hypothetical protein